jgi:hypothetical protein
MGEGDCKDLGNDCKEVGGVLEKRAVICVLYGVWGERVPSEPNGGMGVGGVAPSVLLDICHHLRHNLAMD